MAAMYRKSLTPTDCSIARTLDQVGEWWSLLIVRECLLGTTRFDEFQHRLGIARNVLTSRLNQLCEQGIIKKVPMGDGARRCQYQLEPKGEALFPVIVALMQWGDQWASDNAQGGPIRLVDNRTGKAMARMGPRSEDGPILGFREVRFEATPWTSDRTCQVIDQRNRRILGESFEEQCPQDSEPTQTDA
jgi:DNA-binding HxlR family transcriptional regulator